MAHRARSSSTMKRVNLKLEQEDQVADDTVDEILPAVSKAQLRLDKQAQEFCNNLVVLRPFANRMDVWFAHNRSKIRTMLNAFSKERRRKVSYDIFKKVMRDLKIPCNEFEMHVVCRIFDKPDRRMVSFNQLENGLEHYVLRFEANKLEQQQSDQVRLLEDDEEFVNVMFRFIPFQDMSVYPGNFSEIVTTDTYVEKLHEMISNRTNFGTQKVALFRTRDCEHQEPLLTHLTLRQLGVRGGSLYEAPDLIIFFNVFLGPLECPILKSGIYKTYKKNELL